MKIVAMIPYWKEYRFPDQSISNRDTLTVGGHSLIERVVRTLQKVKEIDEIVIYTSNVQVKELLDKSLKYVLLNRDSDLDDENISIEDIISRFMNNSDADIILLMHPKCPFLKPESISDCINKVVDGEYDSAFIGSQHKKLAWFNGKPLNYSLESGGSTQSLSSLEPVVFESSSVYVFTRELFDKSRRRVGLNPHMKFVGHFEGFEIDRAEDFEMAELIVNAGLDIL